MSSLHPTRPCPTWTVLLCPDPPHPASPHLAPNTLHCPATPRPAPLYPPHPTSPHPTLLHSATHCTAPPYSALPRPNPLRLGVCCKCVSVCVCVCVRVRESVCERERVRERERKTERERLCVCLCVCVWTGGLAVNGRHEDDPGWISGSAVPLSLPLDPARAALSDPSDNWEAEHVPSGAPHLTRVTNPRRRRRRCQTWRRRAEQKQRRFDTN